MFAATKLVRCLRLITLTSSESLTIQSQFFSNYNYNKETICLLGAKKWKNSSNLRYKNTQLNETKSFSATVPNWSEVLPKRDKPSISILGQLRKQTGYSLSLCKKALENCNQDLDKAKLWLEEQAQAQGWNKANKLEGRNTSQGLIGVCLSSNEKIAAIVELNSETDFVARNKQFHGLLNEVISMIVDKYVESCASNQDKSKGILNTQQFDKDDLRSIPVSGDPNKTLGDLVAINIGQIGENIVLRRAVTFAIQNAGVNDNDENIRLAIVTHPSANMNADASNVAYGRFGVILAYSKDEDIGILPEGQTVATLARQLCQHIIGMNPSSIGNIDDSSTWPKNNKQATVNENLTSEKGEGVKQDEHWEHLGEAKHENSSSNELIHQSFLLDNDLIVRDLLLQTGMRIKSFVRFELGEQ